MLSMTFISPPAFAAEGGDSGLSKPILALAAAICDSRRFNRYW